ncbi:MAG: CehA/McbA family metallohydrolase, partial [Planctomycetaceae bacterium]
QIQLLDENGQPRSGVIRIQGADGQTLVVSELVSRGVGLGKELPIQDWYALPEQTSVIVPRGWVTLSAFSGLETETASARIDATTETAVARLRLKSIWDRRQQGLVSGNTHLHLMKLSRDDCDRYLKEIPRADDLDVLFLSYLERADADRNYISNQYSKDDLRRLSAETGVVFGNGEEHRHNFSDFGSGYGHVMLLNIQELIQPVSIGPGIMKTGSDGIPLSRGIQQAKRDGATAIWCHNVFGMESEANWLLGHLDAMNIYDGGQRAGFKERFYRLLNVGLKVPFSTGTDWFMYDMSRVYVPVDRIVTAADWLQSLASGRSFITNGPLFRFRVDNAEIGDTVKLSRPDKVIVQGEIRGRIDFKQLELIQNGEVIRTVRARLQEGHYVAQLRELISIDGPGWMAIRIPPPDLMGDSTPQNEFGRKLYGHTSPIYLEVSGRSRFDPQVARGLLKLMKSAQETLRQQGRFDDAQGLSAVLDVYLDATEKLEARLENSRQNSGSSGRMP